MFNIVVPPQTGHAPGPQTAASPPPTAGPGLPQSRDQAAQPAGNPQGADQTSFGVFRILIKDQCVTISGSVIVHIQLKKGELFP